MSTTLKIGYLRVLEKLGKSSLVTNSVFGFPYRISLGDMFSENPYYNRFSNVGEILACASWVINVKSPLIYDIGAHCGFISSQLAAMLASQYPIIIAFEPIPPTYSDLVASVEELNLAHSIRPIPLALGDSKGLVRMNYSKWASMFAQIETESMPSSHRSGKQLFHVLSMPLDDLIESLGVPTVIKMDVEGWEVPVLRGLAQSLGTGLLNETAWCLEWNPEALHQTGYSVAALFDALPGYRYYYLNDYEGQREPMLREIVDPRSISHVCNLFAIPVTSDRHEVWKKNFLMLQSRFGVAVSEHG